MKKVLFAFSFFLLLSLLVSNLTQAQYRRPVGHLDTTVGAAVGDFYLSISGFASPFASIVLTTDGQLLRTAVADASGRFYISQILIRRGLSRFCLQAVDFKRLGVSEACIDIPPAGGSVVKNDIFLPPTIGLSRKEIKEGEEGVIYGYSMPNALITITMRTAAGLQRVRVKTDADGFYTYVFKNLKAGSYEFTSTAELNSTFSLPPKRGVKLTALSLPQQITTQTQRVVRDTAKKVISTDLWFVIVCIIFLILITILLIKVRPSFIPVVMDKLRNKKHLHHDWLLSVLRENHV